MGPDHAVETCGINGRMNYMNKMLVYSECTTVVADSLIHHTFTLLLLLLLMRGVVVSGVGLINEVNRHWAQLVLGCVTVCGRVNHLGL